MEDIRLIKELRDKLDEFETRHNNEFNDIYEILDQLLKSKNEENQTEIKNSIVAKIPTMTAETLKKSLK
jgi:hypothetical protein